MSSERSVEGFTLIEVLVSLTILAVSLAVLFGAFGDGFREVGAIRNRAVGTALAESLLARVGSELPLAPGDTAGDFGNGFTWRIHMETYGDDNDRAAWPLAAYQTSVAVAWRDGRFPRSVTLHTLLMGPKETRP